MTASKKKILRVGHRGAAGHAPENTLKSVRKALALAVDFVEVDVYSVDTELLVFHDNRLERTTNGRGFIMEKSLAYLRSLDAGEGERIPFLREVFDVVDRQAAINVELKGIHTAVPVAELIREYIAKGWGYEHFLVSSFNHHELKRIKTIDANIRIGVLIYGLPIDYAQQGEALDAFSIHPSIDFLDEHFINDAHRRGLKVIAYTANDPQDIARMKKLGVDGLFSNYPERI